jgi:ribosomal 50S subunit-recycling heat shock protein
LCTAGAVAINGKSVKKPNQTVRVGDVVVVPQGGWQRTVRVLALGLRRGPAAEARTLYEEAAAEPLPKAAPDWVPLLDADDAADWPVREPSLT